MNLHSPRSLLTELWEIIKRPIAFFIFDNFVRADPNNFKNLMEKYLKTSLHLKAVLQETPDTLEKREFFAEKMDIQNLMRLIELGGSEIFTAYPASLYDLARLLLKARNEWAHQKDLDLSDVKEIVAAAKRILTLIGTNSAKRAKKHLRQLLRSDYYRHTHLPVHYIPRPDLIAAVKNTLLGDKATSVALHGMGGIGKSVLARAFCDEKDIQDQFADGILWMSFGNANVELSQKLRAWIEALGGSSQNTDSSPEALQDCLAELLKDRSCLLILDDVWQKLQVETFRVGGGKCRTIMTSRDAAIAREVGAQVVPVSTMEETLAIELLEQWSLANFDKRIKQQIIIQLGGLPLAIKLAGPQLQSQSPDDWLKKFKLSKLQSKRPDGSIHDSLEATIQLSLDMLDTETRALYFALVILVGEYIPEAAIMRLWNGIAQFDEDRTRELVTDLAARALCEVHGDFSSRTISIHSLLRQFIGMRLTDQKQLHQALLAAYQKAQTGNGWHTVPDDAYFYNAFEYHLRHTGQIDTLHQVLASYPFLQAKLNATSLELLIHDIKLFIWEYDECHPLEAIWLVLLVNRTRLEEHPEQLAICLVENLIGMNEHPKVKALLDGCYNAPEPSLLPMNPEQVFIRGTLQPLVHDGQPRVRVFQMGEQPDEHTWKKFHKYFQSFIQSRAFEESLDELSQSLPISEEFEDNSSRKTFTIQPEDIPLLIHAYTVMDSKHLIHHVNSVYSISILGNHAVSISEDDLWVWDCRDLPPLDGFPVVVSANQISVDDSEVNNRGYLKTKSLTSDFMEFAEGLALARKDDSRIYLWDGLLTSEPAPAQTNTEIRFGKWVISIASNPEQEFQDEESGQMLPYNSILKIWNEETGEVVAIFDTQYQQVAIAIYPDASMIVSGGKDDQLHFLRPNAALLEILRGKF